MYRKQIAIYVEGQTEQILINHLIQTWWNYSGIQIKNIKILADRETDSGVKNFSPYDGTTPDLFFFIINVEGEGSLPSSIAQRANKQHKLGYQIMVLRDLYAKDYDPLSPTNDSIRTITANIQKALKIKGCAQLEKITIFFAIMEIEAWLLAFSNALSKWAKVPNCSTPPDLEAIKRPKIFMSDLGKKAGRKDHTILGATNSFVQSITCEEIKHVYESKRVPSFSTFWSKLLELSSTLSTSE